MSVDLIDCEKYAGCQAVLTSLNDHTKKIRIVQDKFAISTMDIMSPNLIDNPTLSSEETRQLTELRGKLNRIIDAVAARVEIHRVVSYENYLRDCSLMAYDRLRVEQYVNTVRKINISIQKLKFVLEVFSHCNKNILTEIDNYLISENIDAGKMFILGNMILILELADYVITYLEDFKLEGMVEIFKIYEKEVKKIDDNMKGLEKLKDDANNNNIDPPVKQQILTNIEAREKSLRFFKEEWENYAKMIHQLKSNVGSVQEKIPTLKLIRDNAKNQIDFYDIMKFFGVMMIAEVIRKNLDAIGSVTLPVDELALISLPPEKVRELICLTKGPALLTLPSN